LKLIEIVEMKCTNIWCNQCANIYWFSIWFCLSYYLCFFLSLFCSKTLNKLKKTQVICSSLRKKMFEVSPSLFKIFILFLFFYFNLVFLFQVGMDEEDVPKENYIESKSESVKNFLKPYEYMRVCYFANWAGNYQVVFISAMWLFANAKVFFFSKETLEYKSSNAWRRWSFLVYSYKLRVCQRFL